MQKDILTKAEKSKKIRFKVESEVKVEGEGERRMKRSNNKTLVFL